VMLMLLLAIIVTIVFFDRASRTAALLLVPCFLWIALMAAQDVGILVFNPGA
jgi:benzodiazapine receptor